MNIAEKIKTYYEHEDFINDYTTILLEDRSACLDRIKDIIDSYDFEEKYGFSGNLFLNSNPENRDIIEDIYEEICNNIEQYLFTYNSYYVGSGSVDSVAFGEQEEQLDGLYNNKTMKPYNINYLRKVFNDEGFYVSDNNYAYYDMSDSGIQINIIDGTLPEIVLTKLKKILGIE